MFSQTSRRLIRRSLWLLIGGMLLSPVAGCTGFQSITSEKWLEGRWLQGESEQQVSHVFTIWDGNVRTAQDTVNGGATLHGLVGRLLLLNDDSGKEMDAHGTVMVCMHDMTEVGAGKEPVRVAEWKFDAKSLKQLKKRDRFGDGYTLFLPWDTYHSNVKQVHLQVCYVAANGTRHYEEPVNLTLQTDELPKSVLQNTTVPVSAQRKGLTPNTPGAPPSSPSARDLPNPGLATQVQYAPEPRMPPSAPMLPVPMPPR